MSVEKRTEVPGLKDGHANFQGPGQEKEPAKKHPVADHRVSRT